MKGIILAGGSGTRLYPATRPISKQLLLIYDKPMIYYPLCTLMQAGIRDILIITTPHESSMFQHFLGDGSQWGVTLSYAVQLSPAGIAQAFMIGASFIANDPVCLILGDNILYGDGLGEKLQDAATLTNGAHIFAYYVSDPERYGVVAFNHHDEVIDIIEKPQHFISNYAIIGLYFYENDVLQIAKTLQPSARGEYEISDINKIYLNKKNLQVTKLGRGVAWLDTGTHNSLLDAANFIHVLEKRQGLKIGSPEEIAWRMNFIDTEQLERLAATLTKSGYGEYLLGLF